MKYNHTFLAVKFKNDMKEYLHDDRIMVSSVISTHDADFFNSLYDNICLIADKTWAFDKQHHYRKLNQRLWVQNFKWIEKYYDKSSPHRVRDVIPDSLLAQYGNYEYNDARESLYKSSQETSIFHSVNLHSPDKPTEPWMLDEVEKCFVHLTLKSSLHGLKGINFFDESIKLTTDNDEYYDKCCPLLYTIDNAAELELQRRIANDSVKCLWRSKTTPAKTPSNHEQLTQGYDCSRVNQQHQLHDNDHKRLTSERKNDDESYSKCFQCPSGVNKKKLPDYEEKDCKIFQKSLPLLSPEVPEFFPKEMIVGPTRLDVRYESSVPLPLHYIPLTSSSATERNYYHDKLFPVISSRPQLPNFNAIFQNPGIPLVTPPIMTPLIRSPHHWIPRIAPPLQIQIPVCCSIVPHQNIASLQSICPINHHRPSPIQLNDKIIQSSPSTNNFNNQSAIPVYQQPPELYHHDYKRKSHGVDFNNLILLTKSAMKVRRNQSKNPQQNSSFILESRQSNLKSEDDVLQWLNKGYQKRAKEFINVNAIDTDLNEFAGKLNGDNDNFDSSADLLEHDDNDDESVINNETESSKV
ncbi:Protein of unknown function [Cotesia congregata]|uniref:Uncharacterized protein n=1 Tax=Cotesia congregata TaxID=51543 RepID=A0A8J2MCC8_COTCN|nr:Protein of unknown function [Cotesia congregata]